MFVTKKENNAYILNNNTPTATGFLKNSNIERKKKNTIIRGCVRNILTF